MCRRALLDDFCCDGLRDTHDLSPSPPFCAQFCPDAEAKQIVAVADEEGIVTLLDVTRTAQQQGGAWPTTWRTRG